MTDDAHQTTYAFVARAAMPEELAARFTDPNRPKTEAEHWAVREIEKQRAENDRLRAEIERLKQEPELLRAELIALTNAARKALSDAYDRARNALEGKP